MAPEATPHSRLPAARRSFAIGFLAGLLVTVPVTFLALISSWGERLSDFLVPGSLLLRGLSAYMADWPAAVNMGLVSVANGLVYGLLVAAVAALLGVARRR